MIVLVVGDSGVGKTTIVSMVTNKFKNVNLVKSYTTRKKRNEYDDDHTFVEDKGKILDEITASTVIDGNFYCTTKSQFKKGKINICTVDDKGAIENKKYFENLCDVIIIHISRKNIEIDDARRKRNIKKLDIDYDYEIDNDGDIEEAVNEVIKCIKKYQNLNC